ncbi:glycosyl hydrolase [Natranaeroarchaeum sulfidigenes]|uniref:glycosyl hydrolase n=1 Tax=Natranaeroarchaeum sulfidigenes TaxID=2784880 RepID=UPI001EE5732A|nr:glycosyl hydrolase [Natranaeroarchaeum sulfidigenes]
MFRAISRRYLLGASSIGLISTIAGCSSIETDDSEPDEQESEGETDEEPHTADEEIVSVGNASYRTTKPENRNQPPTDVYVSADREGDPLPTNNWWGSLMWEGHLLDTDAFLWSHPLVSSTGQQGFVFGSQGDWHVGDGPAGPNFATRQIELAGTVGFEGAEFEESVVTDWTDWSVSFAMESPKGRIDITLVRGSPYVYLRANGDDLTIEFDEADSEPVVWADTDSTVGISVDNAHYGLYAPSDADWTFDGDETFTSSLGGGDYLTIALLPEGNEDTLETFGEYAHAHVVDTQLKWEYDEDASEVHTTYQFETEAMEGDVSGTITGTFPHQYKYTDEPSLGFTYESPRGTMQTIETSSYRVTHTYHGILPHLPDVGGHDSERLASYLDEETSKEIIRPGQEGDGQGAYWAGKNYNRTSDLVGIAQHLDDEEGSQQLLDAMREHIEDWFKATDEDGSLADTRVFYYNETWGTMIAYPALHGAPELLNDHHFHYGYYVRGAAEIARNDPDWARESEWGGMVDLLIRDFANPDRDDDTFPFLRTFDPYSGHSWAGGPSGDAFGNNQESSSEAINAYAAIIQWGEYTDNEELRDLGVFLYTREVTGVREYWFDEDGDSLPELDDWQFDQATIVWDRGVAYTTWWTDHPEPIHGINWLPIGGHSLYLGLNTTYADANYRTVEDAVDGSFSYWEDLMWKYRALSDPDDAIAQFDANEDEYDPEFGTTRAQTYHWIATLGEIGSPDPTVTADTPLAAVFSEDDERTYVAYNAGQEDRTVSFSDGTTIEVSPHELKTSQQ